MPETPRVTVRLGELDAPLRAAAAKNGRPLADEIRHRLARSLKLPAPVLPVGNPEIAQESANALATRWRARRTTENDPVAPAEAPKKRRGARRGT